MRCKPGDLVVILPSEHLASGRQIEVCRRLVGHFATVSHMTVPISPSCDAPLVWRFEKPIAMVIDGEEFDVLGAPDEILQPIRPEHEPESVTTEDTVSA